MAAKWPDTMLTLSTHDTKRSGDVRARLNVLSELPEAWHQAVTRWAQANEHYKLDGWPDPNAEYLLYQTLIGAWPISSDRAVNYMQKATREAKTHTSWVDPEERYEAALRAFVNAILGDEAFVADLAAFLAEHRLIERGRINSLAQVALLLTCPGVADLYQGSEVWDLSLVDPDNRRPVDYDARSRLLDDLAAAGPQEALARADEGGPKLWLIHRLLSHRRASPHHYGSGSRYEPLRVSGPKSGHVLAFARGPGLAVVVPRLLGGVALAWDGTAIALPEGSWAAVLGDAKCAGGDVLVDDLLRNFPVAVLERQA
jgi:(1->4)-alpha-D-glucan 1-alpha-D-glucosylmutase